VSGSGQGGCLGTADPLRSDRSAASVSVSAGFASTGAASAISAVQTGSDQDDDDGVVYCDDDDECV
jgi:hypothetical protein